jgi:2-hydroxychromene-2-carboxylate isomerase
VEWVPARSAAIAGDSPPLDHVEVTRRAQALHLPLVWPESYPDVPVGAMRAAAAASADGQGARFGLAALRLAFCGGFDLEDPDILAEAGAAAGISVADCLEAADDPEWDAMVAAYPGDLPAIRLGRSVFDGAQAVVEAAALLQARPA